MGTLDIALSSITFLSLKEKLLVKRALSQKSAEALASFSKADLSHIVGRAIKTNAWNGEETVRYAQRAAAVMQAQHIGIVCFEDETFPPLLKEMFDPPYALFYRGNVAALLQPCVSVVGTRRVCADCAEATIAFASSAVREGFTVVSGLANGIDSFAHRGALKGLEESAGAAAGSTVAVLPCGIDTIVPKGNTRLAKTILERGGCIVSEYMPGLPPEAWRFVQRNRIIAALSPGTIVMQAPPGSGALITADFALGYDRELVLHEACFCSAAESINEDVEKSAKKTGGRSVATYKEDGARIVQTFAQYKEAVAAFPAHTTKKHIQQELFAIDLF